jgi:bifunctional non-homologous end joining protein LigD
MLASNGSIPTGEGWVAEVKWDGFRIIATVADGKLNLRSGPGSDATDWLPELAELPAGLQDHDAVLDGEVVTSVATTGGRPCTS